MDKFYELTVAGLKRQLPICPIAEGVYIAGFVMFGDAELTVACAEELLKKVPEFDYILTPEAKSIPLAYEMSRQSGKKYFVISPHDDFETLFGRKADKRRKLYNGMIKCQLYMYFK